MDAGKRRRGLIIVYTGSGKGKTTAALGTAFRATGYNMRILIVQFMKGAWHYGELDAAKRHPTMEIYPMGEGFTWVTKDRQRDILKAKEAWQFTLKKVKDGNYDMLILDEINYVIKYGFIDVKEVVRFLNEKNETLHVILTGRDAHPSIIESANLVTEMKEIKHPFRMGIKAQRGIEF